MRLVAWWVRRASSGRWLAMLACVWTAASFLARRSTPVLHVPRGIGIGTEGSSGAVRERKMLLAPRVPTASDVMVLRSAGAPASVMYVSTDAHSTPAPMLASAAGLEVAAFVVRRHGTPNEIEGSDLVDRLFVADDGLYAWEFLGRSSRTGNPGDDRRIVTQLVRFVKEEQPGLILPLEERGIELLHRVHHAMRTCSVPALADYLGLDPAAADAAAASFLAAVQGPEDPARYAAATFSKSAFKSAAAEAGLDVPATVSVAGLDQAGLERQVDAFVHAHGFPIVVKQALGRSGGEGVFIAYNRESALDGAKEFALQAVKQGCFPPSSSPLPSSSPSRDARAALEYTASDCDTADGIEALFLAHAYPQDTLCDVTLEAFAKGDSEGATHFSSFRGELVGASSHVYEGRWPGESAGHPARLAAPALSGALTRGAAQYARHVGFTGIACLDWIHDAGTGATIFYEVNARICGTSNDVGGHHAFASAWVVADVLRTRGAMGEAAARHAAAAIGRLLTRASACARQNSAPKVLALDFGLLELSLAVSLDDVCFPAQAQATALVALGGKLWPKAPHEDPLGPGAPLAASLAGVGTGTTALLGSGLRADARGLTLPDPAFACSDVQEFSKRYQRTGFGAPQESAGKEATMYHAMDVALDLMFGGPDDPRGADAKDRLRRACQ